MTACRLRAEHPNFLAFTSSSSLPTPPPPSNHPPHLLPSRPFAGIDLSSISNRYLKVLFSPTKGTSIGFPFAQSRSSLNQHLRPKTDPRLPRRRFFFEAHQLSPRAFLIIESFDPTFFPRVFSLDFSSGFCSL